MIEEYGEGKHLLFSLSFELGLQAAQQTPAIRPAGSSILRFTWPRSPAGQLSREGCPQAPIDQSTSKHCELGQGGDFRQVASAVPEKVDPTRD